MHGPEAVTSRRAKPYIDTRRVKPNLGDGHDPRPAFAECREEPCRPSAGGRTTRSLIEFFRARSCDNRYLTAPAQHVGNESATRG
jgi:hypothetical protein